MRMPAIPIATASRPAPPITVTAPGKLNPREPQTTATAPSNSPRPLETPNAYGEDAPAASFQGLLHHALDRTAGNQEAPLPAPVVRFAKASQPELKPVAQSRSIGNILPTAVHQDNEDSLPLFISIAVPSAAAPQATKPASPAARAPLTPRLEQDAPQSALEAQPPASAAPEAFSVRMSSPSAAAPESIKPGSPAVVPGKTAASVTPVTAAVETFAAPAVTTTAVPANTDLKPATSDPSTSLQSIESLESPAPVAPPATPVRDLALHLPGAHGVEVRLNDNGGQLHVQVRAANSDFTQDLRDNLHELVSGLERKGFSAQVSYSGAPSTEHLFARPAEAGSSNDSPSDGRGGAFAQEQEQNQQRQSDRKFDGRSAKARAADWSGHFNSNLETRNS